MAIGFELKAASRKVITHNPSSPLLFWEAATREENLASNRNPLVEQSASDLIYLRLLKISNCAKLESNPALIIPFQSNVFNLFPFIFRKPHRGAGAAKL